LVSWGELNVGAFWNTMFPTDILRIPDRQRVDSPTLANVEAMKSQIRKGTSDDIPLLVALMAEFYGESGYQLNRERAARAFAELFSDDRFGGVWLIQAEAEDVGYVVVTWGFSMEYGGRYALLDDLFIRSAFRGAGLGKAALMEVRATLQQLGVRALHVEVGPDNTPAQALYRRIGFVSTGRQLLTLRLADPTHLV
jgi:ribosomal protein S18 acetylase RimI-like enzyme